MKTKELRDFVDDAVTGYARVCDAVDALAMDDLMEHLEDDCDIREEVCDEVAKLQQDFEKAGKDSERLLGILGQSHRDSLKAQLHQARCEIGEKLIALLKK